MTTLREKITATWRRIPKPLRSGWITAWVTFTGTLLTILTSLLPELANAISNRNFEPFYDSLGTSSATAIAASTGFVSGVVNAVYRWIRPIEQAYKTEPPAEHVDNGYVFPNALVWIIGVLVLIILLWFVFTRVIDIQDDEAFRVLLTL